MGKSEGNLMGTGLAAASVFALLAVCHSTAIHGNVVEAIAPSTASDTQGLFAQLQDAISQATGAAAHATQSNPPKAAPDTHSHKMSLHDRIQQELKQSEKVSHKARAAHQPPKAASQANTAATHAVGVQHVSYERALTDMAKHYCSDQPHKLRCDTAKELQKHFDSSKYTRFLSDVKAADCAKLNSGSTFCKALNLL